MNWLAGNLDMDPLFEDPTDDNFTLSKGSPAIDAGTDFFALEGDTLINEMSQDFIGAAPDMGAFEFDPTTAIDADVAIPQEFTLRQNYPNPFNPSTTITYQLAAVSEVKLSIYNLIGQEVATLVDTRQLAGRYSIKWHGKDKSGKNVTSGLYVYRLETAEFVLARKLLLVR